MRQKFRSKQKLWSVNIIVSAFFSYCAFFLMRFSACVFFLCAFFQCAFFLCAFFLCAFFLCAFFQCAFFLVPKNVPSPAIKDRPVREAARVVHGQSVPRRGAFGTPFSPHEHINSEWGASGDVGAQKGEEEEEMMCGEHLSEWKGGKMWQKSCKKKL